MSAAPVHVVWELTLRCDLACHHCGSRAGKKRTTELTTAECLDVVRQLAEMGTKEISLIGGEAYLRDDWDTIAASIVDAGVLCTMVSGGRAFTPERARRAASAGVASVSFSIDGLAAAHDRQRGVAGSFDAAVRSARNLRRAGVDVSANSQLNRLSVVDLDGMLDLFVDVGMHGWQVAMTVPMGRAAEQPDWLFQPYELVDVFPRLAAVAERAARAGVRFFAGNNVGYYGPHETVLRAPRAVEEDVFWRGCQAGARTLGIEADGTIEGCPSLPTAAYAGGDVRTTSIRDVWENASALAFARDAERATGELWGFCKTCYYAPVCRGGCSWTAHVFFGRRGNNPYCHHRAIEHARRGLRERVVQVARGTGAPFDHGRFDLVVEPLGAPVDAPAPRPARRLPLLP